MPSPFPAMNDASASPSTGLAILADGARHSCQVVAQAIAQADFPPVEPIHLSPVSLASVPPFSTGIVVVPILGDNELVAPYDDLFDALGRQPETALRSWLVVLVGDVHQSDHQDLSKTVIVRQIAHHLRLVGGVSLYPHKVAPWNIDGHTVAIGAMARQLAVPDSASSEMAALSIELGHPVLWDPSTGVLDMIHEPSGEGLLRYFPEKTTLLARLGRLPVRRLLLARSGLTDEQLCSTLNSDHLSHLDLSSNAISHPAYLGVQTPALRWLSLGANDLRQLDLTALPSKLQHLYLHKNRLEAITLARPALSELQTLSLYRNELRSLPDLSHLTQLHTLNLGANPLKALPEWVFQLPHLHTLGLAQTALLSLPDALLEMASLATLDISHCEERYWGPVAEQLLASGKQVIVRPAPRLPS